MSDPSRERRALERAKELDHAHRARFRSFWDGPIGLPLRLRFLRAAARRLFGSPSATNPRRVPRPPLGALAVTVVGHATTMLTTPRARVLTDPLLADRLFGLPRAQRASLHPQDAAEVSLLLLSHAHRDHLHLPSLRRLSRRATVVVPPRCAALVEPLGFAAVIELPPGQEVEHEDLRVTAVAARHAGGRGFPDLAWRGACGYVVRAPGVTAYFAGDTGYFSGFAEIGARFRPDVALLPISGYLPLSLRENHMSPLDALAAFEDLRARLLVPIAHDAFPLGYEPWGEPLRWLAELAAAQGVTGRTRALLPGETCVVRGAVDATLRLG
jgi:L-ascorbate metabolism protein UlaG (beta-lactamase superfamily)